MTAVIEASAAGGIKITRNGVTVFSTDDPHMRISATGPIVLFQGPNFDHRAFMTYSIFSAKFTAANQVRCRDANVTYDNAPAFGASYDLPALSSPTIQRVEP